MDKALRAFKYIVAIQNEGSEVLLKYYKALKQIESFAEILDDLIRLIHRLNRNLAATKPANALPKQSVKACIRRQLSQYLQGSQALFSG